jgi:ring-1,2-phenylacetyl-CoA epoxidase subunit PaaC
MRREETYHLLHWTAWMRRLAESPDTRQRVMAALERLWPDADAVFSPLAGEAVLREHGILAEDVAAIRARWQERVTAELAAMGLPAPAGAEQAPPDGRTARTDDFRWLWGEFTSVARAEPGAAW